MSWDTVEIKDVSAASSVTVSVTYCRRQGKEKSKRGSSDGS